MSGAGLPCGCGTACGTEPSLGKLDLLGFTACVHVCIGVYLMLWQEACVCDLADGHVFRPYWRCNQGPVCINEDLVRVSCCRLHMHMRAHIRTCAHKCKRACK